MVDCYLPIAPELLLLDNGLKQVFGFGFTYGVVPWVTGSGYKNVFGALAGIQVGVTLLGIPLWYWGKQLRHKSARWKVISW